MNKFYKRIIEYVVILIPFLFVSSNIFASQGYIPDCSIDMGIPIPPGFPNANTTGIKGAGLSYSDLTPYSGVYTISGKSNFVLENMDIDGLIVIKNSDNITIRNCRVVGVAVNLKIIRTQGICSNITIENCEVRSNDEGTPEVIGKQYGEINGYIKIINCDLSGAADGLKGMTNMTVEGCYIHHLYRWLDEDSNPPEWTHNDVVQVTGGNNIVFRGNTFLAPYQFSNAVMQCAAERASIDNLLFENNYCSGGGYCVRLSDSYYGLTNCSVLNNVFEEGTYLYNAILAKSSPIMKCNTHVDGTLVPHIDNMPCSGSTVPVTGVTVSPTSLSLTVGQSFDLSENPLPANATNKSVDWTSNSSVATVSTSGLVTAVAAGNAIITVTTADGGYTATCVVTVTDTPPPTEGVYYCDPVNGSMANDGSLSSPWSSLQAVFAAGKTFDDGDIIYLMSGNHGTPVISESNGAVVTITKAPGQTPVLTSIKFSGAANWLLSDVKINPEVNFPNQSVPLVHPVYPIFVNSMVQIEQSSGITVDNCQIISYENVSAWTTDDWNYKAWNGVYIQDNSQDITISQNLIKNVNFGLKVSSCTNALMEYNTIENFCGDGIRPDAHGTVVQYNTVKNVYNTNGNHDDLIQVALTETTGLEIRGNILLNYTDPNQPFLGGAQGISMFDGMYYNCIVENNVVVADHWNGIVILGAENCTVVNNTLIDPNDTGNGPPWLQIDAQKVSLGGKPSINNIVSNNLCTDYKLAAGIGVTQNNVEFAWSARDTYFTNFATYDLSLKAGSPAIDAGTLTNAPAIDINGTSRPQGSGVDVGAYEYVSGISGTLPSPWTNSDIGAVAASGSATFSNGVFTVNGSGANIWNSADEFQFVYQQIEGDAIIIAQITSLEQVHQWTKGGVMMRESLDANSINGNVFIAPVASNGSKFSYRTTTGATSSEIDGPNVTAPYWLRLERVGDTFTGLVSADGITWTTLGSTTLNMSTTYYVGLSVVSLTDGTLATATFDNVTVQSPTPFVNSIPTIDAVSDVNVLDNAGQQTINLSGISDGDGNTQTVSVTASSSNTAVANNLSVNYTSGNTTGTLSFDPVAAGTATITITVTDDGGTENGGTDTKVISFDVTVEASVIDVDGISVAPASLDITEGGTAGLTETVSPSNATNQSVTWTTSNASVATVDANGNVSAILEGNCTITVTSVSNPSVSATCTVNVTAAGETTVTLNPVADAFVRGGTYENDNYGNEVNLDLKTASASYTREVFLKFDLSSVSNPASAILRLFATTANSTQALYLVNDNSWTETGITYSNKPASGSVLNTSVSPVLNDYVEIDILSTVQAQAGGLLTLQLVGNSSAYTVYSSKEGANAPELVITSEVVAPTALIDEDFSAGASNFTFVAGGDWNVAGESYVLSNPGDAAAGLLGNISIHNTEVPSDFELNTIVNITGTTSLWNDATVVFNYQNIDNYYYVSFNESNDGNTSGIFKVAGGTPVELCDITSAVTSGVDLNIQIIKTGSDIVVNLNGSQVATATDATFTGGYVGYGSKNDGATFDNLVVWDNGGAKSGRVGHFSSNISEISTVSSVIIYPNPCYTDELTLDINSDGNRAIQLYIFDMLGKQIFSDKLFTQSNGINRYNLPGSILKNGIYMIKVVDGSTTYSKKIVVKK